MKKLLKLFGKGVVTTLLLPFLLIIWAGYSVYCLVSFVVMFFVNLIGFFRGKNNDGNLIEDLESRKILLEKEQADEQTKQMVNVMYANAMAQAALNQQMFQQQQQQVPVNPLPPLGVENYAPQNPAIDVAPVEEENKPIEDSSEQPQIEGTTSQNDSENENTGVNEDDSSNA